jgi:predicted nucleotidyltransferase
MAFADQLQKLTDLLDQKVDELTEEKLEKQRAEMKLEQEVKNHTNLRF